MKVKVKSIEIDFSDNVCDCPPDTTYQEGMIQAILDSEWIVDCEDEIVEEISNEIGWSVYKIDYEISPESLT